jgi:hypothetical protein
MSWVAVGVAGTTAIMGYMSEDKKAKQQQAQRSADIESNRYSGINGQYTQPGQVTANPMMGGVQGGLSGAAFAQGLKKQDQKPGTFDGNFNQHADPNQPNMYQQLADQNPYKNQNQSSMGMNYNFAGNR